MYLNLFFWILTYHKHWPCTHLPYTDTIQTPHTRSTHTIDTHEPLTHTNHTHTPNTQNQTHQSHTNHTYTNHMWFQKMKIKFHICLFLLSKVLEFRVGPGQHYFTWKIQDQTLFSIHGWLRPWLQSMRAVRALCPMTTCFQRQTSWEEKAKHEDRSRLTSTSGHSVHVVVVSVVIPSVAPNALQASVCDEQLVSIGGEMALSGNTPPHQWRRSRHAVSSLFWSFTHAKVQWSLLVPQLVHSPLSTICWIRYIVCTHRNLASFDSFMTFASFDSISIASTANLTFLSFLSTVFAWGFCLTNLCTEFLNFRSPYCFCQHVCRIWFRLSLSHSLVFCCYTFL